MNSYSAFPVIAPEHGPIMTGLSKREYFAAMAMQGLCANSNPGSQHIPKNLIRESLEMADELLKQLES